MKEIRLSNGLFTKVDDEDYIHLSPHKWQARNSHGKWYASRTVVPGGVRRLIWMAREVMPCPEGMEIDHVNGDSLDNRRENLRVVTHQQNMQNRVVKGYKGVSEWNKTGRWVAHCKRAHLGYWKTPEAAAQAYNAAAAIAFGEYACLNDLPGLGKVTDPPDESQRFGKSHLRRSRFRGVYPKGSGWGAQITLNGETRYLGVFLTEEEAAAACDRARGSVVGAQLHATLGAVVSVPTLEHEVEYSREEKEAAQDQTEDETASWCLLGFPLVTAVDVGADELFHV
jgi:hypothetical protein